jgi:hypothetical protein
MHSVKYGVSPWGQIRTSLTEPCKKIEKLFPIFVHGEHLMGGVSVEKETLTKQREIPMKEEEDD